MGGAQAFFRAVLSAGELLFCAHHGRALTPAMTEIALEILDESVFHAAAGERLVAQLRERGYNPILIDLSELLLGGGGVKCCTLELRHGQETSR